MHEQTLADPGIGCAAADLDLYHVQPASVLWDIVELQAMRQASGFGRREGLIKCTDRLDYRSAPSASRLASRLRFLRYRFERVALVGSLGRALERVGGSGAIPGNGRTLLAVVVSLSVACTMVILFPDVRSRTCAKKIGGIPAHQQRARVALRGRFPRVDALKHRVPLAAVVVAARQATASS
jgi:hypothetical protein